MECVLCVKYRQLVSVGWGTCGPDLRPVTLTSNFSPFVLKLFFFLVFLSNFPGNMVRTAIIFLSFIFCVTPSIIMRPFSRSIMRENPFYNEEIDVLLFDSLEETDMNSEELEKVWIHFLTIE